MPYISGFKTFKNIHVLKFLWLLSSSIFWLLIALWSILLSLGLILHFFFIPHIDQFRPRIEASLSQVLGTNIKIGSIQSRSNSLFPSLELLDITSSDDHDNNSLHIKRALVSFSAQSVFRLTLDKLLIDDSDVTVKRRIDGGFEVAGFLLSPSTHSSFNDSFFSIHDFEINNSRLLWIDERLHQPPLMISDINFSIQNGIRNHQFRFDATPPSFLSKRINFRAEFNQPLLSLHPGQWQDWSGQSYFQTDHLQLSHLASSVLPANTLPLKTGQGWFRAWSTVSHGAFIQHVLDFDLTNIESSLFNPITPVFIYSLTGRIQMAPWKNGQEWTTENLTFNLRGEKEPWDFSHYRLALSNLQDPFGPESEGEIVFNQSSFEHIAQLAKALSPRQAFSTFLYQLNIKGDIEKLHASWGNIALQDSSFIPKSALHNWIENSKKLLNRFSLNKKSASSAPLANQLEAAEPSFNPFSKVKHFKVDGFITHLERSYASTVAKESLPQSSNTKIDPKANSNSKTSLASSFSLQDTLSTIPHFKGLSAQFSLTENSGKAELTLKNGFLELIGALEPPIVEIQHFSSMLDWSISNGELDFHLSNGELTNTNGTAAFNFKWFNPNIERLSSSNLGDIDLNAQINSLDAASLYKYLPSSINANVRNYLKEAIFSGLIEKGKIKIKGPLETLPYKSPSDGEFTITAHLHRIGFNYFPKAFFKSPTITLTDWPNLSDLEGELQLKGKSLVLSSSFSNLGFDMNSVQLGKLEAKIQNLFDPILDISSDSKGLMSNYLSVFNRSSLSPRLGRPLAQAKSRGYADLKLKLTLPLLQIDRSKVLGNLTFINNDLSLTPDTPLFLKTRGSLTFTESGLAFQNVLTHTLGGESKLEGGYRPLPNGLESALQIRSSGTVSAEGLEQSCEISAYGKFASLAKGQTNYTSLITIKKSGIPEISISSNLQGLSLNGPLPLKKSADSPMLFYYENALVKDLGPSHFLERQAFSLGDQVAMRLYKDTTTAQSNVLSGTMLISPGASNSIVQVLPPNTSTPSKLISNGWTVNATLPELPLDDWQLTFNSLFVNPSKSSNCGNAFPESSPIETHPKTPVPLSSSLTLPNSIKVQTDKLNSQGRVFHAVSVVANRDGNNWSTNLQSQELNGNIKLLLDTDPASRRISAHLNQFTINPIKNKFSDPLMSSEEPFFPWLDVVIDNLQIKDHALGHVEFEAHNSLNPKGERIWRLNNIQLTNPDVSLKASAKWSPSSEPNTKGTQSQIDLSLDIANSGHLLSRLGTPGVVRDGKGSLKGQLSWKGSLINPDFDSLSGDFVVDIEKGQFLKTDPGASRLLGVLNLQALPRRLTLDFKDLFGEGFAFDLLKGDIAVKEGTASTKNLIMKGVAGTVMLEGSANIGTETQDLRVVVVPEINAGTASLIYSTVNPIVGLTSFLAQYVIRQPLIQANTRTFHISGSWSDPQVTKIDLPVENIK